MNDPIQNDRRVSEEEAHRLLVRAVALDGDRRTSTTLAALRIAAEEAGIAPEAFDEAVRENAMIAHAPATNVAAPRRTTWETVVATFKVALGFWVALMVLAQVSRVLEFGWALVAVRFIVCVAIGVVLASRSRVRWMQVGFIGLGVASVAKLAAHLIFGITTVQGGPTQLAVLGAGLLGAVTVAGFDAIKHRRVPTSGAHAVAEMPAESRLVDVPAQDAGTSGQNLQARAFRVAHIGAV